MSDMTTMSIGTCSSGANTGVGSFSLVFVLLTVYFFLYTNIHLNGLNTQGITSDYLEDSVIKDI